MLEQPRAQEFRVDDCGWAKVALVDLADHTGLLTVAVFFVAIAGVVYLFRDFAESYTESTAPQADVFEAESRDACLERTERRREYLKAQRDDIESRQRKLERGEMETQNQAHRDYLEKYYADTLQKLDDQYDEVIHETCDTGKQSASSSRTT